MTSSERDPKFYVVGGPVLANRECYLHRNADAELLQRLSDGEYCQVLAQRQTGKTSLAAATAGKLRAAGVRVALVDLTRASSEDPSENSGRWYYSIAYRIVRELRIKSDVQSWWKERGGLTNLQRMREFFLEVVLQETDSPVAIFFDRVEATIGEPLAQELFSSIRACYDARVTDIEFQRLSFAIFGSAAPAELVKNVQGSPFEIAANVALPDFSPQELAGLVAGLGDPLSDEEELVGRVWTWTRGHPYLSQKVFRGLARRKDERLDADTVDDLVQNQFLSPTTLRNEPHLSAIEARMVQEGKGRVARLNLYGRIRKGVQVMFDPGSRPQRELLTAGLVSVGEKNEVRVRNEIYAMVFGTRWVNQSLPFGFKGAGIAAAIAAALLALPIWYSEYLPRPYINALAAPNQDYEVAMDAYESLHFLPGYETTANRLLENYLAQSSRQVETLTEMMRIHSRVMLLPDGEQKADELLAEFWERRARTAANSGDRDAALIALLESLQFPNDERRRWAGELIGRDYRSLAGTLHTSADLRALETDEAAGLLTLLDDANRVDVWRIDGERPRLSSSTQMIAEERLDLEERHAIDNVSATPRLLLRTNHPRPVQVALTVRSPAGQEAQLRLSDGVELQPGLLAFDFARSAALRSFAGTELAGNWSIAVSDLEQGIGGELYGWDIVDSSVAILDESRIAPQPIPEPRASTSARTQLAPGGRFALSWPAARSTRGPVLVWDVVSEEILARVPRDADFVNAYFVLNGSRVLTVQSRELTLWDSITGAAVGRIPLNTETGQRITLSADGRYAAVKTLLADNAPGVAVWDMQRVRQVGPTITAGNAATVAVASGGRYLAIGGRDTWVRVWSLSNGTLLREFEHSSPLRTVLFDPQGEWLATDDLSSTFRVWNLSAGGAPVIERLGSSRWSASFAADSSSVLFGSADRAYEVSSLPDGRSAGIQLRHASSQVPGRVRKGLQPALLAARNRVVTTDASRSIKVWSVPGQQLPGNRSRSLPGGTQAALSSDGQRIAVGTASGDVRIYAVGAPGDILLAGNEPVTGADASSEVLELVFSPDRRLLASATLDGQVRLWDAQSGQPYDLQIVHPDGAAHDLLFTSNNAYLISASRREVIVSDLQSGEVAARLRIQANHPRLALAEDVGDVFIADDLDGVTVWNWRTGMSDRIIDGDYDIRAVAVTPDGRSLVTASDTRVLTHWDVELRQPLEQVGEAASRVDEMWISTTGNRLMVQAGYWLQSVALFPNGLAVRNTRLLSESPAAVQPEQRAELAYVLSASQSRPTVQLTNVGASDANLLEGDPLRLREYWRDRLAMTLDAEGQVQPLSGQSLTLSIAQPVVYQ